MTNKIQSSLRRMTQQFDDNLSLGGQIVKQSYICFVNKGTGKAQADAAIDYEPSYTNGNQQYLVGGITARHMPTINQLFLTSSNKMYPGNQGIIRFTGSQLKKYAETALGQSLKHELRRYYGDKFIFPIQYGSLDLA